MRTLEGTRKALGRIRILAGLNLVWVLLFVHPVEGGYDYEPGVYYSEASEYRNAADADDLIERGRASVAESPEFRNGIRLAALATEEQEGFEPGVASSIYYFDVPRWTEYLKITVEYRDVSMDDDVAGRLWIKTSDGEKIGGNEYAPAAPVCGDTFVLRTNRTSETIYVPADRHVVEGTIEIHLVASGRDSFDVGCIRAEYLKRKPARIRVVHHYYDDYWDRWPPHWYGYHYFYWGPCYWPRTSLIYVHWIWPHGYYWHTYRPWYRIHVIRYRHHHPHWYRRYSPIHHVRSGHSARKKISLRSWNKERRKRVKLLPTSTASVDKNQKARRLNGSPPRSAVPIHTGANKIRRQAKKRLKSPVAMHTPRSKPVFRRGSRTPSRNTGLRVKVQRQKTRVRNGRAGRMLSRHQVSNPAR